MLLESGEVCCNFHSLATNEWDVFIIWTSALAWVYTRKQATGDHLFLFFIPPPQKKTANGLSGGLGWFGFLGSPYERDCSIGAPLESSPLALTKNVASDLSLCMAFRLLCDHPQQVIKIPVFVVGALVFIMLIGSGDYNGSVDSRRNEVEWKSWDPGESWGPQEMAEGNAFSFLISGK